MEGNRKKKLTELKKERKKSFSSSLDVSGTRRCSRCNVVVN
jgi:hypothetical protein